MMETLVLSAQKEMLKTLVVAPGILYGKGEDAFHSLFREAWMCETAGLPIIGDGNNVIPTIHVADLCSMLLTVMGAPPAEKQYIVAVDQANLTQKAIVQAISSGIGQGQTVSVDPADERVLLNQWGDSEILLADIKFETEPVGEFEWQFQTGMAESMARLRAEFVHTRQLRPVRVFLHGPPASGKSFFADRLGKQYYLPVVRVGQVVQEYLEKKDAFAEKLAAALEESSNAIKARLAAGPAAGKGKAAAPAKPPAAADKGKKPLPSAKGGKAGKSAVLPESDKPRLPAPLLCEMMKLKLRSAACANKGFILDGFPRTLEEAKGLFGDQPLTAEGDEQPEEAKEENKEEGEDGASGIKKPSYDPTTKVDFIITLDVPEEAAIARLKALPESSVLADHNDEKGYRRRLNRYQIINDPENEPPMAPLTFTSDVEVLEVPHSIASKDVSAAASVISAYLEKRGKSFNYHPTPEEEATQRAEKERKQAEDAAAHAADAAAKQELETRQRAEREEMAEARRTQILHDHSELVETLSQPLRSYLLSNVIPPLVEGLLDVCATRPEDPVDHLAEFLFKYSLSLAAQEIGGPAAAGSP